MTPPHAPAPRPLRAAHLLVVGAVAAALAAGAVALGEWRRRAAAAEPPVLSTLPAFTLTDHTGAPFGSEALRGRPWVANFIFTRCPTVCPALSSHMAELQERTRDLPLVELVSFSVDPEFDTPAVLAEYGRRFDAGPRWHFLTGSYEDVRRAIEDGLKVAMGRGAGPVDPSQVFHGTHFVVVDAQGRVRGYHDVSRPEEKEALLAALRHLAAEVDGAP